MFSFVGGSHCRTTLEVLWAKIYSKYGGAGVVGLMFHSSKSLSEEVLEGSFSVGPFGGQDSQQNVAFLWIAAKMEDLKK